MYTKTRVNKQEGNLLKHNSSHVKNVSWELDEKKYIIYNVPFDVYKDYVNNKLYQSDVVLKLILLKDLMEAVEIPSSIDFQQSLDIALD